ncbi:2-aminoethylphosphonate--pyruvate transaminase, partial [Dysosmobacter welbionis]
LTHMKTPSLGPQGQMLCDGAKRQRGEEGQRCEDVDYEHQDHSEGQGVRAQGAHGLVDKPLAHQGTGDGQLDHDGQVPAEEHGQACGDVPEVAVVCQTLKAGAVVGRGRGVLIQHLAQAVETRVGDSLQAAGGGDRQRGEEQDQEGMDDDAQRGELHLPALDLLAQVFGRTANHQAADEHCQDGVHNHVHQADALAAEDHVQHHVQQGDHAAQRRQGIVHVVDGAGGERGRGGGEHGRLGDAEPDLLALHAAHGLIQADLCQSRVALELRPVAHAQADQEDDTHGQEDRAALPAVDGRRQAVVLQAGALLSSARRQLAGGFAAGQRLVAGGILLLAAAHHLAEGDDAGAGEEHHGVQLDHVRDDRGVLQR